MGKSLERIISICYPGWRASPEHTKGFVLFVNIKTGHIKYQWDDMDVREHNGASCTIEADKRGMFGGSILSTIRPIVGGSQSCCVVIPAWAKEERWFRQLVRSIEVVLAGYI